MKNIFNETFESLEEYFINNNFQSSKSLQHLCDAYNSANGQTKVFNRLNQDNFFNEKEKDYIIKCGDKKCIR